MNHGDSIWRVAQMHEIAYSLLQRALQAGGETKTRAQAYENDMVSTIAEEKALEQWCLHMHRWGYPTWFDILRSMVEYVLSLKIGNGGILNALTLSSLEPTTTVECRGHSGNLIGSNLGLLSRTWYV